VVIRSNLFLFRHVKSTSKLSICFKWSDHYLTMCFYHKLFLFVSTHNNFWASVYNLNFVIIHDNVSISVFIIAFSRKSLENKIRRRKDHVLNYPNAKKITHETVIYILRNYFFFHGITFVRQFLNLVCRRNKVITENYFKNVNDQTTKEGD
jgi:hypothetical protein